MTTKKTPAKKARKAKPRKPPTPKPETVKPTPVQEAPVAETIAVPPKRKRGRPTRYSEPLAKALCKFLASGYTLHEICSRKHMPHEPTVLGWARNPEHPFSDKYMRAREVGYMKMADDLIRIADDSSMDWLRSLDEKGNPVVRVDHDHISRARLRVDTRKWLLAKALPKIFGDKVISEHVGKDGGPIQTQEIPQAPDGDRVAEITKRFTPRVVASNA